MHPTHDRDGRAYRPSELLTYGWETVPEIAARLGRHPKDVTPLILEACRRGEGQAAQAGFGRGFHVPVFRKRAPLLPDDQEPPHNGR